MRVLLVAACSLTLSFGAAIGVNLQKYSMTREEEKSQRLARPRSQSQSQPQRQQPRPPYLQPLWWVGFGILVLDACGDFVFIGLAPQSLLAPLGALSLGFNVVLAPVFHPDESRVTRPIVTATALIYFGTILTVLFASQTAPSYSLEDLKRFLSTKRFLVYESLCFLFLAGLLYHAKYIYRPPPQTQTATTRTTKQQQQQQQRSGRKKGPPNPTYGIVHYCGIAGCLGGQCIMLAKSSSELVQRALRTGDYTDWTASALPYLFVSGMVATVVTQMYFLNTGLARYDALVVVPVYQSFWTAFGITGGLVFFQEDQYMRLVPDVVLYAIGIVITLVGVSILIRERSHPHDHRRTATATTSSEPYQQLQLQQQQQQQQQQSCDDAATVASTVDSDHHCELDDTITTSLMNAAGPSPSSSSPSSQRGRTWSTSSGGIERGLATATSTTATATTRERSYSSTSSTNGSTTGHNNSNRGRTYSASSYSSINNNNNNNNSANGILRGRSYSASSFSSMNNNNNLNNNSSNNNNNNNIDCGTIIEFGDVATEQEIPQAPPNFDADGSDDTTEEECDLDTVNDASPLMMARFS